MSNRLASFVVLYIDYVESCFNYEQISMLVIVLKVALHVEFRRPKRLLIYPSFYLFSYENLNMRNNEMKNRQTLGT